MTIDDADLLLDGMAEGDRELLAEIKDMIRYASNHAPRSLQKHLGPSEIGTLCDRQLAYGLTATGKCNSFSDPWPSVKGVAVHKWLEEVAIPLWNEKEGEEQWLPEHRVKAWSGAGGEGTCDAYHRPSKTILDWKNPGPSAMSKHRRHIGRYGVPTLKYRVQAHTYGAGYAAEGIEVEYVGIVFFPIAGTLNDAFMWRERFDPQIAAAAMVNIAKVQALVEKHHVVEIPANFALIPKTPSDDCRLCSYWSPNPVGPRQCSGQES